MHKQLTEEQLEQILAVAIHEFGNKGYTNSSIGQIAKLSKVSVGVIYKYYEDKAALFFACIEKSLALLSDTLSSVEKQGGDLESLIRGVIRNNILFAKEHPDHIRMYHVITTGDAPIDAAALTIEIEKATACTYKEVISKAKSEGVIHGSIRPEEFAFFFDNLMMMLHFSYACDYYKERLKLYSGEEIFSYDEKMEEAMLEFLIGGFGMKK